MSINSIGGIQYFGSKFYIHDIPSHSLFIFSDDGQYLSKIDKRGRSSEEYLTLASFDVNRSNGNICIYDVASRTVKVYSSDGMFLRNVQIGDVTRDFAVLDNGDFLFATKDYIKGMKFGIWQTDSLGNYKCHISPENTRFYYSGGIEISGIFFHLNDFVCVAGNEENDFLYHIYSDTSYVAYQIQTDIKIPLNLARKKEYFDKSQYKGKVFTKLGYYETNDIMTISGTDMEHFSTVYYDKKNGEAFYFTANESFNIENDIGGIFLAPVSCYDDGFIGVIMPEDIDCNDEETQTTFPGIKKEDNPIIVLMKTRL